MANFNIDYLVVAGGGGGGGCNNSGFLSGAGGGAGGMRTSFGTGNVNGGLTSVESTLTLTSGNAYSVTVGVGGAGMIDSTTQTAYGYQGVKGSDSIFNTITSTGGGGGGAMGASPYQDASSKGGIGGSGGGSGFRNGPTTGTGSAATPYNASPVQGFVGGLNGPPYSPGYSSGGGGGAGGIGGAGGPNPANGPGGLGLENAITGTNSFYAGGGGGSTYKNSYAAPGLGGSGIGGNGGGALGSAGVGGNGTANTGSGGGGGNAANGSVAKAGGSGGSGVVILRYPTADAASYTTTGITPTETTDGTDTILSFTTVGTGTITFTAPAVPITPFDGTKVTTPVTDFDKTSVTQGLKLPSGTNTNQPTGVQVVQGMIRNDTDETTGSSASAIEHHNGTNWQYFAATESPDVVYPTSLKLYLDASNADSYPGTGTTWFDLTSNVNNGTITGPQWNSSGWFDFDGTSDVVSIPSTTDFNATSSNPVSMGGWFYMTASQLNSFWSKGSSIYEYFCFGRTDQGSGNYISFSSYLSGGTQISLNWTNSAVTNNTWYHVIVTADTSNQSAKLYVNGGAPKATDTSFSASSVGTQPLLIGRRGDLNWDLQGRNSKFQFYSNKILTQAEVQALYDQGF